MHPAVECGMANREGWLGMDLISLKWKIMFMKCNPSENRGFLLGNACKNVSRRLGDVTDVMDAYLYQKRDLEVWIPCSIDHE